MTARLLNGNTLANTLQQQLAEAILQKINAGFRPPGLAVILANNDAASATYVEKKRQACKAVHIESHYHPLSPKTAESDLLALIQSLNADPNIDGILVQLPLPAQMNAQTIIEAIHPDKDVDGFHPYNLGRLLQKHPSLRPCTPYGIMQLLNAYDISVTGKHAVIIGASNIVGRPMACEFLMASATVTICHRMTKNLEQFVRNADLLVVATGAKDCIDTSWLQAHQVLIDVGIHRLKNKKLRGDVDFEQAKKRVAWITPVPGGVGPMTVATLLQNTFLAYSSRH